MPHGDPWASALPPSCPRLTTDRDAALLPPQRGVRSVAPGPSGAAVGVAAEILLQVGLGVGGNVDSGKGNRSVGGHAPGIPDTQVSLLPILSPLADRPACHSLRLMWVTTPPQLALDA